MLDLKKYKMFIGGEWLDSDTKKTFETLNPENNKPWAIVPEASASDVDKAVKAAQKAFEGDWPKLLPIVIGARMLEALIDKYKNIFTATPKQIENPIKGIINFFSTI